MADQKLWEVPQELKLLMDMCLSIESALVYMHFIQVPTYDDLQQYPHGSLGCFCSGSW